MNEILGEHEFELVDITIKANDQFNESGIEPETLAIIKSSL